MKKAYIWKKLTAMAVTMVIFMTDQSISYAVNTTEGLETDWNEPEQATSVNAVLHQEDFWYPVCDQNVFDKEDLLFDQEFILDTERSEDYEYKESYGSQLSGLAGDLYGALKDYWEDVENIYEIPLGEFITEEGYLDGQEYRAFCSWYEQAAQNAFDAFWYDEADAEYLDTENSGLKIRYTGSYQEDGSCQWQGMAVWEIFREETEEPVLSESEEVEEVYAYLEEAYLEIADIREQDQELQTEYEVTDEAYARRFKRSCEQAGVECVLVKGVVGESVGVWNMVHMEDENWYTVDIPRRIFLKGSGDPVESESSDGRCTYGDFSNSHNGFFVYPEWSESEYMLSEKTGTLTGETVSEESGVVPEEVIPEESEAPIKETISAKSEAIPKEVVPEKSEVMPEKAVPEESEAIPEKAVPEEGETPIKKAISERVVPKEESIAEEGVMPISDSYQIAAIEEKEPRVVPEKVLTQVSVSSIKAQTYTGGAITPKITVKDTSTRKTLKAGKQYTVSYENNVNAGIATIVIRGIESAGYDGVLRVDFTINPLNISKVKASIVGKEFPFTGGPVTPGVNVQYKKSGLKEGSDYQISYVDNVAQGKKAQIQLTGTGNYIGTKTLTFKITSRKIKNASVVLSSYSDAYAGNNGLPTVSVTYDGQLCQENVDYTVSYPKTLKIGKNNIVVKGKGNYTGSVKATYVVSKASLGDAEVHFPYAWQYTGKKIKPLPTSVTVGGVVLQASKDYTVKYQIAGGKKGDVKNEGNYQIVLTGKKNYQGTLVFDFCVTTDQNILAQNYNSAESTIINKDDSSGETTLPDTSPGETVLPDTSPDETVEVENDKYFGYYEGYKIFSKKGIQGVSDYTEELRAQHVLLNVDMADLISTNERPGYVPYVYRGKTYYFSDLIALKDTVYYLHGWGGAENPYGANHMRNVTFVLLMSWRDELSYLIHPSARKKGAAPYYTLNMEEAQARETFEALFRYMGEEFGAYKTRVSNWTLGNEVNSCKEWNYSGSMSLNDCVANYAQAFQLLYQGVNRVASSSRVFISLDHCWTDSVAGHSGKSFLDQFAAYMNQTARNMEWNVNYHPYSQPLSRIDFWKDNTNTTNSSGTKYISMKNIQVLTDYLSDIESMYGKGQGSIRVIIGELGYTARQGKDSEENSQAAALGYGYYIAMFNTRIDSYIIRAYLDDPAEMKSGLYLGLRDSGHAKKEAYDVYTYLDTEQSLEYMNKYMSLTGIQSWESVIPGFDANALIAADF